MSAESVEPAWEGIEPDPVREGLKDDDKAFAEALAYAEQKLAQAAKWAEKLFREATQTVRSGSESYSSDSKQTAEQARRFVVEAVKARPVTALIGGFGVGMIVGLLLSSRGK